MNLPGHTKYPLFFPVFIILVWTEKKEKRVSVSFMIFKKNISFEKRPGTFLKIILLNYVI